MPHLVWQEEPNHLPADETKEMTTRDLTAKGFDSWTEDQDWQDRFWWPSHQKLILRALAYGDCVWAGECKGAEGKDLPLYVLANLRTERKGSVEEEARGLLREWGDMLTLVCIILCMMATHNFLKKFEDIFLE